MESVPVVRLLSMALRTSLEQLHAELARAGYPELGPTHGYALNVLAGGATTASALASQLGMTKQGAAKVMQHLLDEGYVTLDVDPVDTRNRPATLTRRGRAAVRASVRIQDRIRQGWERHAPPGDVGTLVATLEAVVRGEHAGELPPARPST